MMLCVLGNKTSLFHTAATCACSSAQNRRRRQAGTLPRSWRCSRSLISSERQCTSITRAEAAGDNAQLELLELELPTTIDGDLRSCQEDAGAYFSGAGVPLTFHNEDEAATALAEGAVVIDRSHWGRFRVSGEDRASFLHGQSTADIGALQPGQGCPTVFVTPQGRCVDVADCLVQPSGILCLVSPNMTGALMERLNKYIFFGDKVELTDISSKTAALTLTGPNAAEILSALEAGDAKDLQPGQHMLLQCGSAPVVLAASRTLGRRDYTLVADESVAGHLWQSLISKGALPMGEAGWQRARILAGRPQVGEELTEEITPLEAGLCGAVSLNKGCYIGQETLAKVHAKGIAKQLIGIRLEGSCAACDAVTSDGEPIGKITSVTEESPGRHFALGYLRCRQKGAQIPLEGKQVDVNGVSGVIIEAPFLQRQFVPGAAPQLAAAEKAADTAIASEDAAAAEAAAKAERLKAMQERLASYQALQSQQQG